MVPAKLIVLTVVSVVQLSWLLPFSLAADLTIPIANPNNGSPILVDVHCGEMRYTFLVDTGAAYTLLDTGIFKDLTTPYPHFKPTDTPRDRHQEEVYNPGNLSLLGKIRLPMQPLYLFDLSDASAKLGTHLDGLIGIDFLKDYQFILDSDHGRLSLSTTSAKPVGRTIPLQFDNFGRPIAHFALSGPNSTIKSPFLIDTGATGFQSVGIATIHFDTFLSEQRVIPLPSSSVITGLGKFETRNGIVSELALLEHHDRITVSATPQAIMPPNHLGMGYLTQFNVVIDFPNATLYVSPRKTPGMPLDLQDCSGFGFVREQGMILIKRVEPASPAFKADLRLDDAILAVNGVAGEKIDLYQLRFDLCQPGKEVKLKIRRNRREHSVTLHLEDWNKPVTAEDFE